jgi:hypothetical protein
MEKGKIKEKKILKHKSIERKLESKINNDQIIIPNSKGLMRFKSKEKNRLNSLKLNSILN